MNEPIQEQLLNEELETVYQNSNSGYRHGTYETLVFHREVDDTFWQVKFNLSTDGEEHGLRDNDYSICQVWPKEITVTIYVKNKEL